MRIIGGTCRGMKLATPKGLDVRPTRDAVREALFNILGEWVAGKNILDLYAGTGSLGLEALSRGAKSAVFVENHPVPATCIEQNLEKTGLLELGRIERTDVLAFLREVASGLRPGGFHAILADPPFAFSASPEVKRLVTSLNADNLWGRGEGIAMIEVEARGARFDDLERLPGNVEFRSFGRNLVCLARKTR